MRTMKVFVLTEQEFKDGDSYLDVKDVFTTKTAAKEKLCERKEELKEWYEDNCPDGYTISDEDPILFSISSNSSDRWNELLITEKEISI